MPNAELFDQQNLPGAGIAIDARQQDDYWSEAFAAECYVRPGLDYEDYAPAYCVGYVGYAQYGEPWEDAEKSLWANWERIKGGSRLTWCEARPAIRAAWDRVELQARREARAPFAAELVAAAGPPSTAVPRPASHPAPQLSA